MMRRIADALLTVVAGPINTWRDIIATLLGGLLLAAVVIGFLVTGAPS